MTTLSQSRSGITQLEFHQAMNDFKTMFPEMDEDVIEVVLRANNGAVDATIDQLLAMNMDSEREKLRTESVDSNQHNEVPPRYAATPPPTYQQAVPFTQNASMRSVNLKPNESNARSKLSSKVSLASICNSTHKNISKDSMRYSMKWNPPLLGNLPDSFLRIELDENQRKIASLSSNTNHSPVPRLNSAILQKKMEENQRQRQMVFSNDDPELSQYLEDERIAIFLQNEEFVKELRRNKDFMSTLELDTAKVQRSNSYLASQQDAHSSSAHSDSDAAFKETLKHMGKVSRRKFAQLARLFSGRKRRSFQHLSEGNNPSCDNLLLREDEYTQFQNEGSDLEDNRHESRAANHHENRCASNKNLSKF